MGEAVPLDKPCVNRTAEVEVLQEA